MFIFKFVLNLNKFYSLIPEMGVKYDLAIGLNKGHKTTKIDNPSKKRQSRRKGVSYGSSGVLFCTSFTLGYSDNITI